MVDRSRAASKTRQETKQSDQSDSSESRSVRLGGVTGEQSKFPKTSMKARALISDTEVDPHRESHSHLFAKRPVQSYRQKVAGDRSKPSLLSQRLKVEALRVPGSARELTPQQRIRIADVFVPTAADWAWRRRTKKSGAAEPVATILSINRNANSSTEPPGGDDPEPESEYVLAAGPQRSSQLECLSEVRAKNSLRSSQTTDTRLTALSLKKEGGTFSTQGLALKTLAALHSWAKSRPKQCVSDVKDIGRLRQARLQLIRENNEPGGRPDSVVVTQQLQLPPAIPPIAIQRVTGFNTDSAGRRRRR